MNDFSEALAQVKRRRREQSQGKFMAGDTVAWEMPRDASLVIPIGGVVLEVLGDQLKVEGVDGSQYTIPAADCHIVRSNVANGAQLAAPAPLALLRTTLEQLEAHLDDPDNSNLSNQGMLESTRGRLSTLYALAVNLIPAGTVPARPAPIELQSVDAWGRPRCQEIRTYTDDPSQYQCAMTADHAGDCDPLPIWPDSLPMVSTWQDTRADDGLWLAGSEPCPNCPHVLMSHRSDVGCVTCDCQHGISASS